MPPAAMTMSLPSAWLLGQELPKGPRTPITSSGFKSRIAFETVPTARVVCTSGLLLAGSPLIEIGISPTPKT